MPDSNARLLNPSDICLITSPKLAQNVGRTEAIFLQQLHYWLTSRDVGMIVDGQRWVYNSYKSWVENIKIFSESTVRRAVKKLENMGIVLTQNMNKRKSDQTKWYTINYDKLENFLPDLLLVKNLQEKPQKKEVSLFKMNRPGVQNEQILYKETEITSETQTLFPERKGLEVENNNSQQVNVVKQEMNLNNQNNTAASLLEIWNQTVGKGGNLVQLTKKRAQHLVAAFKYRFHSSMSQWKHFCHQITTSDFLMGKVKETFRASLDWVLKFDILQRIGEGDFGVKPSSRCDNAGLEQTLLENLSQDIVSGGARPKVKELRQKILKKLGGMIYRSWFQGLTIQVEEEQGGGIYFQAHSQFVKDYIETHYLKELRASIAPDIHIFC